MPNTEEMVGKLVESIRSAPDRREGEAALQFASGYIGALDDFKLITPEESREARAAVMNARSAGEYEAPRLTNAEVSAILTSGDGL
ncbi:hypothetical protein AB6809_28125 [Paraburkholderia sp. RCC_158]|uniref:hypothetical protein n=1 Tax=Paraburkholderia sp. RCC_158 TaxID=3239220 RepID=UPI003525642C